MEQPLSVEFTFEPIRDETIEAARKVMRLVDENGQPITDPEALREAEEFYESLGYCPHCGEPL